MMDRIDSLITLVAMANHNTNSEESVDKVAGSIVGRERLEEKGTNVRVPMRFSGYVRAKPLSKRLRGNSLLKTIKKEMMNEVV